MATASSKKRARSGGLGNVAAAAARQGKGKAQWVKLSDGDVAVLRMLDTGKDFKDGFVHRTPMEGDQGTTYVDVMCLDQKEKGIACPGCKDDLRRSYKFWTNVIVRDHENEVGETEDVVMIWSGGISIAKQLDKMAAKRDLRKRDIEVEREGKGKNDTKYMVAWADDEDNPLSENDLELESKKFDLTRYTTIPDYDDFYTPPWERDRDDDEDEERPTRSSFARRKKTDDDEDDDEPRTARKSKKSSGFTPRSNRSTNDDESRKTNKTASRRRRRSN